MFFQDPFLQTTPSSETILAFKHNFIMCGSLPAIYSLEVFAFEFNRHGTLLFIIFGSLPFYLAQCLRFSMLLHVCTCSSFLLLYNISIYEYNTVHLFFSPVLEHSDSFHFFDVVNSTVTNSLKHVSLRSFKNYMHIEQLNQSIWTFCFTGH